MFFISSPGFLLSVSAVVTSLRGVFLLLLGSLSALHLYWFWLMLEKTYKAVAPGR